MAAVGLISASALCGASESAADGPITIAQAGGTGGTIGKIDKSISGRPDAEQRVIHREPRRPASSVPASPCGRLPGEWSWFNGGVVTIASGGSANSGTLNAHWTCASGRVVIHWSHGFVDRLTLSRDGSSLTGSNGLIPVWGKRK